MLKMILFVLVSFILVGCANTSESSEHISLEDNTPIAETYGSSATYAFPESLEEIENASELIVKVKLNYVIEIGGSEDRKEEERRLSSISEVEIIDIFKGDASIGDDIVITELFYLIDEELATIEHYVPMEEGEEYVLFLSNYNGESWRIEYLGFGKYHPTKEILEEDIQTLTTLKEARPYSFVTDNQEEVELYRSIREDVLEEYFQ